MRLVLVLHKRFVSLTVNRRIGEMNWPSKVIKYVCIQHNKGKKCFSEWFTSSRGTTGLCAEGQGDYYYFFLFNGCFVFVHGLQHYCLVVGNLSALKLVFFPVRRFRFSESHILVMWAIFVNLPTLISAHVKYQGLWLDRHACLNRVK